MNKKPTILIVEDDVVLLDALNEKLKENNFNVLVAKNGLEGLKKVLHENVDLILLDIIMPRMDGLTMLKRLRENPQFDASVIILTNLSSDEELASAKEMGVNDYLIKADVDLDEVVAKIKEILK